jgi:hypothetical protein
VYQIKTPSESSQDRYSLPWGHNFIIVLRQDLRYLGNRSQVSCRFEGNPLSYPDLAYRCLLFINLIGITIVYAQAPSTQTHI